VSLAMLIVRIVSVAVAVVSVIVPIVVPIIVAAIVSIAVSIRPAVIDIALRPRIRTSPVVYLTIVVIAVTSISSAVAVAAYSS